MENSSFMTRNGFYCWSLLFFYYFDSIDLLCFRL